METSDTLNSISLCRMVTSVSTFYTPRKSASARLNANISVFILSICGLWCQMFPSDTLIVYLSAGW